MFEASDFFGELGNFVKEIYNANSYQQLLPLVMKNIEKQLGFSHTWIYRYVGDVRTDGIDFELLKISSNKEQIHREALTEFSANDDPLISEIFHSGGAVYVEDCQTDPRTNKDIIGILNNASMINCLVTLDNETLGVLGAGSFDEEGIISLDKAQQEYFEFLANMLGGAMDRLNYREKSHKDPLTGLDNRRGILEKAEVLRNNAKRQQRKFAILFIDLNEFKYINDSYGHKIGDLILLEFARRLTASIRESDIPARLGGDEFVVLLSEVSAPQDISTVINKIRNECSGKATVNQFEIELACSIGSSVYDDDGDTIEELLLTADERMYQEKKISSYQYHNIAL